MICNYHSQNICRSCTLLPLGQQKAFAHKIDVAHQQLKHFLSNATEEPPVSAKEPFGSRHKVKLIVSGTPKNISFGIVDQKGGFVPLEECPLHTPILNDILANLKKIFQRYRFPPYDIKKRTGEIKAVILSANLDCSQLMVRVILKSKEYISPMTAALKELVTQQQCVKVASINIQPIPHAILEGEEEIIISIDHFLSEKFNDITLFFEPQSFMQVTPYVAEKLYQTAGEWIQQSAPKTLLDLYCGVGGFALHAAQRGMQVTGVETSTKAVISATKAAEFNQINDCTFIEANLDTLQLDFRVEALIVNPPRRGLSKNVLSFIHVAQPQIICYSSCNPITLAQDLQDLTSRYTVTKIRYFDMFPLTDHLETLIELRLHH